MPRASHKGAHATRGGAHNTRGQHVGVRNADVCHGREVVDAHDDTRRAGTIGPHTHGNAARHVVDDLNAEVRGQRTP